MMVMVFLKDLLNMLESILNRLLKYFSLTKKLKSLNSKVNKLLLKAQPLLSKKSSVENFHLSLNLPLSQNPMTNPSKLLLAKTSNKLFLIQTNKFQLNSTPHGVVTAKPLLPIMRKPHEDFQIILTSFQLKLTQLKTKFQDLIFKVSQLLNSTKRTNQPNQLNSEVLVMLTVLFNGLRKTLSTNGSNHHQLELKIVELLKNNCDHQYSYFKHQSLFDCSLYNSKMNLGRNELLEWINRQIQTQYTSVQNLSDGVAYAQMIDAIHPGSINIFKLNLGTKYPEDNYRNIKLIEDALKKLKITQPLSFQKISKGKFHDNIVFLQWLYGYANRNGLQNLEAYLPYEKRLQILQKQGKSNNQLNLHLKPNEAYYHQQDWQAGVEAEEEVKMDNQIDSEEVQVRLERLDDFVRSLQSDLKEKMELNWRMMHLVDKTIQQRNCLYSLLSHIDKIVEENHESPLKAKLLQILHEKPAEYE